MHSLLLSFLRAVQSSPTTPYADICLQLKVSKSSMTRILNRAHIDKTGTLKSSPLSYTQQMKDLLVFYSKSVANLEELATLLHTTRQRLSSIYSKAKIYVNWPLEQNHNPVLSASRLAELFVKEHLTSLGYKLVQDSYTSPSEKKKHVQKPYDLIFSELGSVDVKSSVRKLSAHNTPYVSFNTSGFSKGIKWCAGVCFDESRTKPIALWIIPGSLVAGHNTIHISLNQQTKYTPYLIWSDAL